LVLSTILPISINARKDRDLKAMEEKYEATIAVLREQTVPGPIEPRMFFDMAKSVGGLNVKRLSEGSHFVMQGRPFHNGIYMIDVEAATYSFWEYELTGVKDAFTELEFFVGVLDISKVDSFSYGKLIVTFNGTNEGKEFELTSDMDITPCRMPIPKGARTIRFEFINAESGNRPAYGMGNICVR